MRVVNNIKALVTLGSYAIKDGLENQLIKTYGKLGENNMYQLQMAVLRYAFRRHRLKMIKVGIVLALISLFHRWLYKPFVERVVVELFYTNNPNPKQGAYVVKGTSFQLNTNWELTDQDHPTYKVYWDSKLWPSYIFVWNTQNKEIRSERC